MRNWFSFKSTNGVTIDEEFVQEKDTIEYFNACGWTNECIILSVW